MPPSSSCTVIATVYTPSSAYVWLPAILPVEGVPGMPLVSATLAPETASRPSPQLMSYVNDSATSPPMTGFSGLSKPGSLKLDEKETAPPSLIVLFETTGASSAGATLLTVTENVLK